MKNDTIQLEILLLVDTTFSYRELCSKEIKEASQPVTDKTKWAAACWNALLNKLLPEVFTPGKWDVRLHSIIEGSSFLGLELGHSCTNSDTWFSIQPAYIRSLAMAN